VSSAHQTSRARHVAGRGSWPRQHLASAGILCYDDHAMLAARSCVLSLVLGVVACNAPDSARFSAWGPPARPSAAFGTVIVRQPGLGGLNVSVGDKSAPPVALACATCHGDADQAALARREGHPSAFHADIAFKHGQLKCKSCHDAAQPSTLRLSSGDPLPLTSYIDLCAQCHGPQYRDYQHGSHGGMKGYWDLQRGPRERNGCIACHGAHDPVYPQVLPAAPPNDRFLEPHALPGSAIENRWSGGSI
jgi:hypothetical protein